MLAGPPADQHGSTLAARAFVILRRLPVTFMHKLASRLSLLKARSLAAAALLLSVAVVFSCERPVSLAGVDNSVAVFVVTPVAVTLQPNQMQDFVAVGLTP